jgi:TonB family protein
VVFAGGSAEPPATPDPGQVEPAPAEQSVGAEEAIPPPAAPEAREAAPVSAVADPPDPPPPPRPLPMQRDERVALAAAPAPPLRRPPPARPPFPDALDLTGSAPARLAPLDRVAAATPSPAVRRPPGTLDLSPGARRAIGPTRVEPMMRIEGPELGTDWRNAFRAWLEAHKRYPREAIEQGEEGPLMVRLIVEADGRVRLVDLRQPSRSFWLNRSAVAMFRGAVLPPFPPGTAERSATIDLTINYILIR